MNRDDIDLLISLNEDFDRLQSSIPKKTEEICGWVESNSALRPRDYTRRPNEGLTQKVRKLSERSRQKQNKNTSLSLYHKKETGCLNLSPLAIQLKGRTLREKFFPEIRTNLPEKPVNLSQMNSFDLNFDRCRVSVQDKSFRLTSVTPVMMVRRKNLYY